MTGEISFDLTFLMNGSLAGLVAITGGCGVVEPWAAVIIGMVAGLVFFLGSKLLVRLRLDDAVDAIPVHCFSGMLGVIAVGLFASPRWLEVAYGHARHPGWFYAADDGVLLGTQCVGLLFIVVWVTTIMLPFFIWLDWKGWFRSDPLEELVGLDTSYHGGLALLNRGEDRVNPEYITALKERRDRKEVREARPTNVYEARPVGVFDNEADDQTGDIFQTDDNEGGDEEGQAEEGTVEDTSVYGMVSL